ncbi:ABC transporter ATP-binding protein [Prosthecochloris sp. N3]|uniref:ABC transporter ATP-binding protein n=1 Tax=Prosthecochloris ethylica TaxID=2743976 RepID=A0ABR9XR42_9CHLB|nr:MULTISPECIES: ABC transporter ATP-binding protein [Prosthecochloris]MBF0586415.1 ABC transporter ATP-binding protein [Prosthecochloris ethylica]MBF0636367.1 ABC transporter ATP-binding protein [Prosthecochloris ethylica]NUK47541.1 ABC transporter ATP-binding protein [Prosthecochloris ethylica]RNA64209.1 ABC transporter ATP-binding protein [Prosthecochloris sp. ZM_2]
MANARNIDVRELSKSFGDIQAVDAVSFEVRDGEIFGFLGPNGAGKTTTINMLTGLARPDSGHIVIGGIECSCNPKAAQHLIGVVPDESNLYPELTGFDNLCFCGALYGMPARERRDRARDLLELFGLSNAAERLFGKYSKGMKRRLVIAAAMMHEPAILFLDEPTSGIDVQSARQIRRLLLDLHRAGTTIFLTTHQIDEAERLCQRVAFLVAGRIRRIDTIDNLLQPVRGHEVMVFELSRQPDAELAGLERTFPSFSFSCGAPGQLAVSASRTIPVAPLVRYLDECGIDVLEARRQKMSLEEVFVRLTGIEAHRMKGRK